MVGGKNPPITHMCRGDYGMADLAEKIYNNMTIHQTMWIIRLIPVVITILLIVGFLIGSYWVDKSGDEMMRQMTMVLMIARGN